MLESSIRWIVLLGVLALSGCRTPGGGNDDWNWGGRDDRWRGDGIGIAGPDLAAVDWCWKIEGAGGVDSQTEIAIYPIFQNRGSKPYPAQAGTKGHVIYVITARWAAQEKSAQNEFIYFKDEVAIGSVEATFQPKDRIRGDVPVRIRVVPTAEEPLKPADLLDLKIDLYAADDPNHDNKAEYTFPAALRPAEEYLNSENQAVQARKCGD